MSVSTKKIEKMVHDFQNHCYDVEEIQEEISAIHTAYADMDRQRDEALQRVKELESQLHARQDTDEERELFETARMYAIDFKRNYDVFDETAWKYGYSFAATGIRERNRRRAAKDGTQ